MLSKEEIGLLNSKIYLWYTQALEKVHEMDEEEQEYFIENVSILKRKNSKAIALAKAEEICNFLELENVNNFVVENKWDGYFGLDYVFERTLYKVYKGEEL